MAAPTDLPSLRARVRARLHVPDCTCDVCARQNALEGDVLAAFDELERERDVVAKLLAIYGPDRDAPLDRDLLLRWLDHAGPDPVMEQLAEYHETLSKIAGLAPDFSDSDSTRIDKHLRAVETARAALGGVALKGGTARA